MSAQEKEPLLKIGQLWRKIKPKEYGSFSLFVYFNEEDNSLDVPFEDAINNMQCSVHSHLEIPEEDIVMIVETKETHLPIIPGTELEATSYLHARVLAGEKTGDMTFGNRRLWLQHFVLVAEGEQ